MLVALGATLRGRHGRRAVHARRAHAARHARVLTLNTPRAAALDVLAEPDGSGGYARLRANAIEPRRWAASTVRIAGLDDLIAMKKAAGRPKDRIYVEELEAIRRLQAG